MANARRPRPAAQVVDIDKPVVPAAGDNSVADLSVRVDTTFGNLATRQTEALGLLVEMAEAARDHGNLDPLKRALTALDQSQTAARARTLMIRMFFIGDNDKSSVVAKWRKANDNHPAGWVVKWRPGGDHALNDAMLTDVRQAFENGHGLDGKAVGDILRKYAPPKKVKTIDTDKIVERLSETEGMDNAAMIRIANGLMAIAKANLVEKAA